MADIAVPFWLFLCVFILALIGFVDRIFSPAMRWFFRRKVNAVIDELNTRLPLKIRQFKMTDREVLIDRVWGTDYVGDTKTLDVHVKRLRAKLEPDPSEPKYLVTVRGLGYKLDL